MSLIVFVWQLLSFPSDRLVCSMWIQHPPTRQIMDIAGCRWDDTLAPALILKGIDLYTRQVVCERPASELPTLTCDLWPLDHYLLQVWEPAHQDQLCTLSIFHEGAPSAEELAEHCPELQPGTYLAQLVTTGTYTPPAPPAPVCPMPALAPGDLPASYQELATSKDYELLASHLIWTYGSTTTLIPWQNQFDRSIYDAGISLQVPPRLIKSMLAQESQFWPVYSVKPVTGEIGLGQLTDNGADLVIRYTPALYERWCPVATTLNRCARGYDLLNIPERQMIRDLLRGSLMDNTWPPQEAARLAQSQIYTWGQVLAAYYCVAAEMTRPAGVEPNWDYALAAYHAGPECIRGGNICQAGKVYLGKVK
jgi:hypothetical protein